MAGIRTGGHVQAYEWHGIFRTFCPFPVPGPAPDAVGEFPPDLSVNGENISCGSELIRDGLCCSPPGAGRTRRGGQGQITVRLPLSGLAWRSTPFLPG